MARTKYADLHKQHNTFADEHEDQAKKKGSIEKSETDLIEKGGEASRGGHVIGHTKSGKPIYGAQDDLGKNSVINKEGHAQYDLWDHHEAGDYHKAHVDHHGKILVDEKKSKAERKNSIGPYLAHQKHMDYHYGEFKNKRNLKYGNAEKAAIEMLGRIK